MTDTLVADGDDNDDRSDLPEQAHGLAKAFKSWVDSFLDDLNRRQDSANTDAIHSVDEPDMESAILVQPFTGDAYDLDDEDLPERLWGAAWDRAQEQAEADGKRNVANLQFQGAGRSFFDGAWQNSATWTYVRW